MIDIEMIHMIDNEILQGLRSLAVFGCHHIVLCHLSFTQSVYRRYYSECIIYATTGCLFIVARSKPTRVFIPRLTNREIRTFSTHTLTVTHIHTQHAVRFPTKNETRLFPNYAKLFFVVG